MAAAKGLNLRFISKIKVVFNPFQWETASVRSKYFTYKLFSLFFTPVYFFTVFCVKIYTLFCIYNREFLRILDTQTVRDSNPKCQIHSEISNQKSEPKIEVQFGMW